MSLLGLSPALGSFLAGVVLANSAYRHQLEARPRAVQGAAARAVLHDRRRRRRPRRAGGGAGAGRRADVALMVLLKMAVLWPLARLFRLRTPAAAAVHAGAGAGGRVRLRAPRLRRDRAGADARAGRDAAAGDRALDDADAGAVPAAGRSPAAARRAARARRSRSIETGTVIIAGMGRFGQTVNRIVTGLGHRTVVLDSRPEVVERLRRLGIDGYYGDVDRPEVLAAAGHRRGEGGGGRDRRSRAGGAAGAPRRGRHPRVADHRPRPRPAPRLCSSSPPARRWRCGRSSRPRSRPAGTRSAALGHGGPGDRRGAGGVRSAGRADARRAAALWRPEIPVDGTMPISRRSAGRSRRSRRAVAARGGRRRGATGHARRPGRRPPNAGAD